MSEDDLTAEETLLLAQAVLAKGAPVKIRSYVKHSTTGKQIVVRQALRGAAGGTGRTPINPPTAQAAPVVSSGAIKSEAAAARAGVAQQSKALQAAQKQAAAALKAKQQKQQQAQQKKNAKAAKTTQPKAKAPKQPKAPHLGNLGGLGALGALHGGHGGLLGGGRRGRLFPGSHILARAIGKARSKKSNSKNERSTSVHVHNVITNAEKHEPRVSSGAIARAKAAQSRQAERDQRAHETIAKVHKVEQATHEFGSHTEAAHRALEIAAAYRRAHAHGRHSTGAGFHERIEGEKVVHEGKNAAKSLHLSNVEVDLSNPVSIMQNALQFHGFPVEVTGTMNMNTLTCLEAFLRSEGVDPDVEW